MAECMRRGGVWITKNDVNMEREYLYVKKKMSRKLRRVKSMEQQEVIGAISACDMEHEFTSGLRYTGGMGGRCIDVVPNSGHPEQQGATSKEGQEEQGQGARGAN
eukprot:5596545-Amphidinium_carterae.1